MKAESSTGFWKRSIKTKIGMMLFFIIIWIFGLFGVFQYLDTKSTSSKELDELAKITIARLAEQLVFPLWEVDNVWVRKIIISEMRDKRIFAISVTGEGNLFEGMKRDVNWQLIFAEDEISGDYIFKSRDIVRNKRKIGSARLYITKHFMINELRRETEKLFLTVILFGAFCIFFLSWMLHKIVIYPINRILRIADAIAKGDYDQDIIVKQQDEIGILGRGFNNMQKKIRQREIERDKSEANLQQSEKQYRMLVETMNDGLGVLDQNSLITYANKRLTEMWGYSNEKIIGRPVSDFLDEANQNVFNNKMKRHREGEGSSYELTWTGKGGRKIDTIMSPRGIEDESGKFIGSFAVITDITERKRAEEALRQLNMELDQQVLNRTAQLEAANRELEGFAYSVSHDLRAPLRHIDGFIELLQKKVETQTDEQGRHYMDAICGSARKMGQLIDDLLAFTRMGRHTPSFQKVALEELMRDILHEYEPDTRARKIDWLIGDLPVVSGDKAMLRVILVNLISNALKFTRLREKARIEIGSLPGQNSETVIYVRDNGVGFDMAYADKLFGVFQRLHRAEEFEGTGIGLANVRRIIARHGGRVWAEGKLDQGATFFFSVP